MWVLTTLKSETYDPAKFAFVLMVKEINFNRKEPIVYFFLSNSCTDFDSQEIQLTTIFK